MILNKQDLELIAHDLNNPIGALVANLGFVVSMVSHNPDVYEAVQDCILSQESLKRMVGNLTALSRLEGDRPELSGQANVADVVAAVERTMRPHCETTSIELAVHIAPDTGWVQGDPGFLTLALENLVATSLVYAPSGSVVELWGRRLDQGSIGLAVLDEGSPVAPELRRLVGQKDGQGTLKSRSEGGRYGRGLGLYVAALVAAAAGGALDVGEEGGRSRFELVLPPAD